MTFPLPKHVPIRDLRRRSSAESMRAGRTRRACNREFRGRSNVQLSQPPNVIPMLAAFRQSAPCTPAEMAGVLRRLHRAGVRKGFLVVAPTNLGGDPRIDPSDGGPKDEGDVRWWSEVCDRIRSEIGLSMVLVNAPWRGLEADRVLSKVRPGKGIAVLDDLTTRERSALLEVSRGVCTGDRNLLAEARALGTPGYEPWEARMAILSEAAGDLFMTPGLQALRATA